MNAYDQVAYPSHPHPQTHPDRLATLGMLYGLKAAPVQRCRVLELGCGNGSNLVSMAWANPNSQFLGVDLAERPIAAGQQAVLDLALGNLRLVHQSVLEIKPGEQEFDYILAHGFYSWVPAEVREHVLALCRGCLAPTGIAFISYGAYPGCHLRNMLREMMLFHTQGFDQPEEKVNQATALLRFLAEGQEVQDEYRVWMKAEFERTLTHDPGHLYHDDLATINQPFYFTEFMAAAARHQLRYLGEADFFEMSDGVFTPAVQEKLQRLASSRLLREQYLDFLKCRRFRQTLLCRQETALWDEPRAEVIAQLRVSSTIKCRTLPVDLRPEITASFEGPRTAKAQTDFPLGKACLVTLSERGPVGLPFPELLAQTVSRLAQAGIPTPPSAEAERALCEFLFQLYSGGVVELRTSPPPCITDVSPRPVSNPVARWELLKSNVVTSGFHSAVQVGDEVGRQLLSLLDGTRDRAALIEALHTFFQAKGALAERPNIKQALANELEENLGKLARLGLLVA
jgi:SAM-dependent methyltransferase/methyltransferase-like protein